MKKYRIINILIALATIICVAFAWIHPLSFREFKAKHEISHELFFPSSIVNVIVDRDDVNWQDYRYAYRANTRSFDEEDTEKMFQHGWKTDKLPEGLIQHAVFKDYKEDITYYDEHYKCFWIYIDKYYERYKEIAFPEEEYRSLDYVFAFYVPARNLLYFVHVNS